MKKSTVISSLLGVCALASSIAYADPNTIQINFTCPVTDGNDIFTLTRFGHTIAGYAFESIGGKTAYNQPWFTYEVPDGANIPKVLKKGQYESSGTGFDPHLGKVTCKYKSNAGYDGFGVSYIMKNGRGALVALSTKNTININQFVGLTN